MKKHLVFLSLLLVVLLMVVGCNQESASVPHDHDHGHEHGDGLYEWSGAFTFEKGTYTMHFKESGDPSITVAFLFNEGEREDSDHHAYHILEAELEEVAANGKFEALPDFGYNLTLDPEETVTSFVITEPGEYLVYTEHFPEEFDLVIADDSGSALSPKDEKAY